MVGKSHQLVGFVSVYTVAILLPVGHLNTQTIIACVLCITVGSLASDLDSQENKLYTLIPIGQKIFAEVGERAFGRHRSISHSALGVVIFGYLTHWLIYMIPKENGIPHELLWGSFMISFVSHLVADALTRDGIPLLWPIKWRFGFPPLKFLRMKTGGWFELYVVRSLLLLFLIYITYVEWDSVSSIFWK
ncbi:MAG: metal-dependent hydrolase [bacterium]|nr:metal-dependent hydrolase [bacterium]